MSAEQQIAVVGLDYLGLVSLGGFVGAIATFGIRFMQDAKTWKQGMLTMIGATLSGSAILFVDRFSNSHALGAYCLGLLLALMWTYADAAVRNLKSGEKSLVILGWLHIAGVAIATLATAALVIPPAILQVWGPILNAS